MSDLDTTQILAALPQRSPPDRIMIAEAALRLSPGEKRSLTLEQLKG